MSKKFFKQCTLRNGSHVLVSWIEERGAKVGYSVTLKDSDDPSKFWEVTSVSELKLSMEDVELGSSKARNFKKIGSISKE